jgi:hypothetical protein
MPDESPDEKAERLATERRAEANSVAHDVSPSAGNELADGSDERKAKLDALEQARKEQKD